MPIQNDRDLAPLRQMLALHAGPWQGGTRDAHLPLHLRRFLNQADTQTLERLLIETALRLRRDTVSLVPDRTALHEALQDEMRRAATPTTRNRGSRR